MAKRTDYYQFQFNEQSEFFKKFKKAAGGDLKKALSSFLQGVGTEFLRVLEDEIIRRKVVDSRLLLNSFHTEGGGIWKTSKDGLSVEIGTNVEYASFVNDGHWTCEKGVESRFVPGYWDSNDRFVYVKGLPVGMVLKQQWVEGDPYWDHALMIMDQMFPEMLESMMQKWIDGYFR